VTRTRAAAATDGLEHYIFVSLPHADKLSGGRIPLQHLDAKAQADEKIRQTIPDLASRMTSLFFGMYMFFFPEPPFKTVEMVSTTIHSRASH
jgi:NmrA-like family protein